MYNSKIMEIFNIIKDKKLSVIVYFLIVNIEKRITLIHLTFINKSNLEVGSSNCSLVLVWTFVTRWLIRSRSQPYREIGWIKIIDLPYLVWFLAKRVLIISWQVNNYAEGGRFLEENQLDKGSEIRYAQLFWSQPEETDSTK